MVDAYSNATRIQMNIKIKAPLIIVPVDSQSRSALCLDLGHLSITNINTEIPVESEESGNAVIDEMKLELKDLKLSKVMTLPTESSIDESLNHSNLSIGK